MTFWFMPVMQKIGPDGCLYILDWYIAFTATRMHQPIRLVSTGAMAVSIGSFTASVRLLAN